jgi:HPt (histidine-containing phosphotransfer) domain-containing protein
MLGGGSVGSFAKARHFLRQERLMAMAFGDFGQFGQKRSAAASRPASGGECAIDLIHLSRQTLGDRALEVELLRLFERQCEQIVGRLDGAAPSGDRRTRQDLAHTLKGSAQAIGARAVAAAAGLYEDLVGSSQDEAATQALAALRSAAEDARRAVASLLVEG